MGALAARGADEVIITDFHPRYEDPASIRAALIEGALAAVPDAKVGDQVACALILRGDLTAGELERFLTEQADLSPKAWPRYVSVVAELPRTATNKVLKRTLASAGVPAPGTAWVRAARGTSYG